MTMRNSIFLSSLLFLGLIVAPGANGQANKNHQGLPSNYVPSGQVMFKDYCSACHGLSGKGDGPSAALLKLPPANLTTLNNRHGGKFPYEYVSGVLRFGTGATILHGSSDMPIWGPILQSVDKSDGDAVQRRIKALTDYLASIQER